MKIPSFSDVSVSTRSYEQFLLREGIDLLQQFRMIKNGDMRIAILSLIRGIVENQSGKPEPTALESWLSADRGLDNRKRGDRQDL